MGGFRCRARLPAKLGALVALLLLLLPVTADLTLSSVDKRLLRQGRIVFKKELPTGGIRSGAMGGTALGLLQADTETVWLALLDFPGHAGLFPRVKESEVIEHAGERSLVRYLVAVGPFAFQFFVINYADHASHVLHWKLDQGRENDLFRDHWGYWKVEPWEEGVLVTYAMGGRTTLPAFLTRGAGKDGTIQTMKALKERVER
ncbi:MAG: SRPBCC family protein [Candidatus Methylomirabilia bacterium]